MQQINKSNTPILKNIENNQTSSFFSKKNLSVIAISTIASSVFAGIAASFFPEVVSVSVAMIGIGAFVLCANIFEHLLKLAIDGVKKNAGSTKEMGRKLVSESEDSNKKKKKAPLPGSKPRDNPGGNPVNPSSTEPSTGRNPNTSNVTYKKTRDF